MTINNTNNFSHSIEKVYGFVKKLTHFFFFSYLFCRHLPRNGSAGLSLSNLTVNPALNTPILPPPSSLKKNYNMMTAICGYD